MEAYFPLAEHFVSQGHPSFCGIGSLTMALNSLLVDPKRVWQGVWRWFDESMLDCCAPHDVVKMKGITMSKLQCLARCNGASVQLVLGSEVTIEDFRADVKSACSAQDESSKRVMIVSYHRPKLNQSGSGHFSPIAGYNETEDMVLIMDVARFKYPPHWAPLTSLFAALQPIDPDSGTSRGYLFVGGGQDILHNCSCTDTDQVVSSEHSPAPYVTVCEATAGRSNSSSITAEKDAVVNSNIGTVTDINENILSPLSGNATINNSDVATPADRLCSLMEHSCSSCDDSSKCCSVKQTSSCCQSKA
jgi:hypothetical protein